MDDRGPSDRTKLMLPRTGFFAATAFGLIAIAASCRAREQTVCNPDVRTELDARDPAEVFRDHLALRSRRKLEEDLARNYSPDVLVLTSSGPLRGHDGIRTTAAILREHSGGAAYDYLHEVVEGDFAYLVWRVCTGDRWLHGADSFRIVHGKIVLRPSITSS